MTDDEFIAWTRRDNTSPVWLVELDYVYAVEALPDVWGGETGTLHFATAPYLTDDTAYIDRVRSVPLPSAQLDRRTLGGAGTRSYGSLVLDNADGRLDYILALALDGQELRAYFGDASWPREDFRQLSAALALKANAADDTAIEIPCSDKSARLNATIFSQIYGSSGVPRAQQTRPIILGIAHNAELVLEDEAEVLYSGGQPGCTVLAGTSVRVNGVDLAGTASITLTSGVSIIGVSSETIGYTDQPFINEDIVELFSTGTYPTGTPAQKLLFVRNKTAHSFQLSETRTGGVVGWISATWTGTLTVTRKDWRPEGDIICLAHPPAGTVTADLVEPDASGAEARASDIIERLMADYSSLEAGEIEGAHASYPVGTDTDFHLGTRIDAKANLITVLGALCESAQAFYTFNRAGKFIYGRISPAALSGASELDLTLDDVVGSIKVTRGDPLYYGINGYAQKNFTVQDANGLSPALTAEQIAYYSAAGLYFSSQAGAPLVGVTIPIAVRIYHRTLTESPERETLISCEEDTDAVDEASDWTQLLLRRLEPWMEFVEFTTRNRAAMLLDLGAVVRFTFDRFSFDAGPKFQLVGYQPSGDDAIALTLFRNREAVLEEIA